MNRNEAELYGENPLANVNDSIYSSSVYNGSQFSRKNFVYGSSRKVGQSMVIDQ